MIFNNRGGGGFKARIAIGLVLAVVALVGYYMKGEKNPFTGETQHVGMNVEQEKALGLKARQQMADQMGGAINPNTDADAALVRDIGNKLNQSIPAEKNPYRDNFNFHLLDDRKTVNAFALPGGQIFITRALFDQMENEAQLAGVLGHEIGHVLHRHSAEQMAKGQLGQSLVSAVAVGASGDMNTGQIAVMAGQMVNNIKQLSYGREDELESDNFGLRVMANNGYSPEAMVDVMAVLKKASGGQAGGSDMFKTHPNPDARVEAIKAYIKEAYPNGIPANLTMGKPLR